MVKPYWVMVGFGAGLLAGIVGARWTANGPTVSELNRPLPASAQTPAQPAADARAAGTSAAAPAESAAPAPGGASASPSVAAAPPATPELAGVPVKQAVLPFEPSVDSGVVQAIDVGAAFAKQIGRPSQPGYENEIGDAHRALEREARDEQWAYAMEGELQNSLVSQASMGVFKVEHVECRATMCEVRLSGQASGQPGLREWTESLTGLNKRLYPNMSSMVSTNERVDALYIFRRPRKPQ